MNYDYITESSGKILYGIIKGDQRIVFIKAGLGGDYIGDEDKYLIMADRLHNKFGCSVIVASNPHDDRKHVDDDRTIIEQYIFSNNFNQPEMLFFGHSNGGIKGLELTASGLTFTKMVLVNMPLMINFHKTKGYISEIPKTSILAVYGEYDPSFPYVPFIKDKFDNVEVLTVQRADHNFKGMFDEYIDLSEFLC